MKTFRPPESHILSVHNTIHSENALMLRMQPGKDIHYFLTLLIGYSQQIQLAFLAESTYFLFHLFRFFDRLLYNSHFNHGFLIKKGLSTH